MACKQDCFVGVDVGTGSARAALITCEGKIIKVAVSTIKTWKPLPKHYEQSSQDVWNACIKIIREVTTDVRPDQVKGIGFDATCSLVALSKSLQPVSLSTSGCDEQNIILWMDHRAKEEADFINNTRHPILKYVGGKVSLEMEIPKILWIKKHLPQNWNNIGFLFDLPDYLTWKATGSQTRSLCSVVCKWNYESNQDGVQKWNKEFFELIGLECLLNNNCEKIGSEVLSPGNPCGRGLSDKSAEELGLLPGTPVGTSIIDAHAGGLGMIGCAAKDICADFETRLSLICGTSSCHMAISNLPIFVPGVWGPYFSAMVPGYWLNEAGHSASGVLVDHILNTHPAYYSVREKCSQNMLVQDYLHNLINEMTAESKLANCCYLTKDLHVWPDFHGNRSPIADPSLLGMISGLTLSSDEKSLALIYLATLQALAYGTRHIMESLIKAGHKKFKSLIMCGGLSKNKLFTQIQADVVKLPLLFPKETESVLVGSAILGACGANYFPSIQVAIEKMGGEATVLYPQEEVNDFHDKKYKVFLKMVEDQVSYKKLMSDN